MGTPGFAAVVLQHLLDWDGCEVAAVFTQPDRPCGRGQVCKPSEVKVLALEKGLPVHQPEHFKAPENLALLADLKPDLLVVAAYGLILPQAVLDLAPHGAINVHASLLPRYRGASPIQRAIMNGDSATGITIMQMDKGMDTGDVRMQRALAIGVDDTAASLHDELADLGGRLLVQALERLSAGTLPRMPQDDDMASHAPKLTKADGEINWNRPAWDVHNHIRAMYPWPGAYWLWPRSGGKKPLRLNLAPGRVGEDVADTAQPGDIIGLVCDDSAQEGLAVACADKTYVLSTLTPAGKKSMTARGFWCGYMQTCEPGAAPDSGDSSCDSSCSPSGADSSSTPGGS